MPMGFLYPLETGNLFWCFQDSRKIISKEWVNCVRASFKKFLVTEKITSSSVLGTLGIKVA